MRRFSFVAVFLTVLSIALAIAVFLRVRSYSKDESLRVSAPSASTTTDTVQPMTSTSAVVASTQQGATSAAAIERARRREAILREAAASASAPVSSARLTPRAPSPPTSFVPRPVVVAPKPSEAHAVSPATAPATQQKDAARQDPNSDSTPPQLIGIQFDPPVVHDGEESRVVMTASDDLSGIRGISGTIVSPTGKALQGFSGQREGDTNRYIGRVVVPKNGEEGTWRVNVVNISDNASNSVTLTSARGMIPPTAVLRVVSSQSDSTPPVLKSVRADKPAMHAGEPNPIYVEAHDDNSGVNLVSAVFQSPSRRARVGAGCHHTEGDFWECDLQLPACIDCGNWQLEQITLQDKANNLATFRLDNPIVAAVKIDIGGDSCDSEAPRLVSVAIDQGVVTMGRDPASVMVTVIATDDACGVEGVSGQYAGPGTGSGGFFSLQLTAEGTFTGRIGLDPRAPRGLWRINSIQLTDRGHNLRIYYGNDPLLAGATFQIR